MPDITPLDLTTKTASIIIVLFLMILCLVGGIAASFIPSLHDLAIRFIEAFFAMLMSLTLALNVGSDGPKPPPAPAGA